MAVVASQSVEQVQAIVRIANEYKVTLWPNSLSMRVDDSPEGPEAHTLPCMPPSLVFMNFCFYASMQTETIGFGELTETARLIPTGA